MLLLLMDYRDEFDGPWSSALHDDRSIINSFDGDEQKSTAADESKIIYIRIIINHID